MDHSPTSAAATFPGPERIEIAFKAARDTRAILDALARAGLGTEKHKALFEAMHPRLRVLASIGMAALTDESASIESLLARYDGIS